MSLKHQTEAPQADETSTEQAEKAQRIPFAIPHYSIILIVSLVVVTGVQILVDGKDSILFGGDKSIYLAGFLKPAFLKGEYWRILTGAALHGGVIHLAFNCYAFYVLGKLIETLSNRAHLAIVFLLSAIGGGILSLIFYRMGVRSALRAGLSVFSVIWRFTVIAAALC